LTAAVTVARIEKVPWTRALMPTAFAALTDSTKQRVAAATSGTPRATVARAVIGPA
jgi:hypothetical protein